jgi:hypothetical protein
MLAGVGSADRRNGRSAGNDELIGDAILPAIQSTFVWVDTNKLDRFTLPLSRHICPGATGQEPRPAKATATDTIIDLKE